MAHCCIYFQTFTGYTSNVTNVPLTGRNMQVYRRQQYLHYLLAPCSAMDVAASRTGILFL